MKHRQSYEFENYRPNLPEGWDVLEHLQNIENSYIAFSKWAKTHHNAEPTRVIAVFCEFNPKLKTDFRYTVRGDRNCKPSGKLHYFTEMKDADAYLRYIIQSTDKWLEEINSPPYIAAYNARIANLVKTEETKNL